MLLPKRSCRSASFYVLDADFLQLWAMTMHIQKSQNWMMFEHLQKPLLIKVKTAVSDQDFP
jgi:hypothetical protein